MCLCIANRLHGYFIINPCLRNNLVYFFYAQLYKCLDLFFPVWMFLRKKTVLFRNSYLILNVKKGKTVTNRNNGHWIDIQRHFEKSKKNPEIITYT